MVAEVARLVGDGAPGGVDFEALKRACRDAALGIMGRMVANRLNADRGDTRGSAACRCGADASYVDRRAKTFTTVLGSMTLERAWYHCPPCGRGFSPRDRALGLENASLSPAVRRMVGIAAGEMSFGHASAALRELAGLEVGAKQVERHAEALGRDIARDELKVVDPEPAAAKTLYVGLDGTGVPMRKSETAGRVGKQAFLAHQRVLAEKRSRSNAHSLFGLARIPCDNQLRQLLDGVPPSHFDEPFHGIVEDLEAHGGLAPMRRLDGRLLIALDGTQFFCSRKVHCRNCSTRKRNDGATYFHQMLAATVVAPGVSRTLPMPPEFIQPRDGAAKQDCERLATKRWLQRHGPRCAPLQPLYLGDDLYACQPVCQAMLDSGGDFLLTAKPASHKTLYEYLDGVRLPTHGTTSGRGTRRRNHRYRWMTDLPIRDGDDALRVNWPEITSARPDGTVHLPRHLRRQPRGEPRQRRRTRRLRARPMEDRERDLQRPQAARLPPRTQLRPWQGHPGQRTRRPQPARLRPARGLRTHRRPMAAGPATARHAKKPVRALRTITQYQVFPSWNALITVLATGGTAAQPP